MFERLRWSIKALMMAMFASLVFAVAAAAQADDPGLLKVVKCEEWVSLREKPDASAECLVQVPLGALVENCSTKNKTFTYAQYQGLSGYIMTQYLEPVPQEQVELGDLRVVDRGEWVAMRVHASDEAPIIQWLAPGMRMEACIDSMNGFAYGECNGLKGYVYLTALEAAQQEAAQ